LNINRAHKDSVFSSLFSDPDVLRELYSAIGGVAVPPDTPVSINTLTDILYKERINDISFTIDNRLVVLIEHQSTINLGIPLRLLIYIARVYEKIVSRKKLYQTKLEKIPTPEFIVLYNGREKYPDYAELKLSDAFKDAGGLKPAGGTVPLELTVQVYNINHGHNPGILKKSGTLDGYSIFVEKVREYEEEEKSLEKALRKAIEYCTGKNILREFLEAHGSEVMNMLLTEWNWDEALEVAREEGWEDGREEGLEEGLSQGREEGLFQGREQGLSQGREEEKLTMAKNLLAEGSTPEFVRRITGLALDEIKNLNTQSSWKNTP
jgi:hypothetical protein